MRIWDLALFSDSARANFLVEGLNRRFRQTKSPGLATIYRAAQSVGRNFSDKT